MALGRKRKEEIVEHLAEGVVPNATSIMVVEYKGLKSSDMTELRARMRKIDGGARLKVVRNTLAKKVLVGTKHEALSKHLSGQVLLVFSENESSGATARLLRDFAKEKEKLSVAILSVEGKLLEGSKLELIANLPTKQEAIAKLVVVMQAPIVKFVRTLAEPTAKLVRTLAAVGGTK